MCGVSSDWLALGVALTGILEEAGRFGSAPAESGVEASLQRGSHLPSPHLFSPFRRL